MRLIGSSTPDLPTEIETDLRSGTENLVRVVAGGDGLQISEDEPSTRRHFCNALFNVMRGGIPERGYWIDRSDLSAFVARASKAVLHRQRAFLDGLPATVHHADLLDRVRSQGDAALERIIFEYLPLTFSRRHGDPSRPWNEFLIDIGGEHGRKVLNYQGNWRDIFQNWEALGLSYPSFLESMIFKFVNACTADGYNPYRVMRDGFDWEVPDPRDAWANIGYWSDHQIVYLLKLLEASTQHHPDGLTDLLQRRVFTYAHVPYRIKPYEDIVRDPRHTIVFDAELDRRIRQCVDDVGADGAKVLDSAGEPYHVNLAEKLLVLSLAKLFNFVPEAGIWMNTQRPEWNDANNALVGHGASMVTVCYLRRYLRFCMRLFGQSSATEIELSTQVAVALREVTHVLLESMPLLGGAIANGDRTWIQERLGMAGGAYRDRLYAGGFPTVRRSSRLRSCAATATLHCDTSSTASVPTVATTGSITPTI